MERRLKGLQVGLLKRRIIKNGNPFSSSLRFTATTHFKLFPPFEFLVFQWKSFCEQKH